MVENSEESKIFKQRRRLNPTHRWTQFETNVLLDAILEDIKEHPESFEKPTAQKFYQRFALQTPAIANINWVCILGKMRYLKGTFVTAVTWKGSTGAGLLASGDEKSVEEYVLRLCPKFDMLEQIFGARKNVNPPVIFDTSFDADNIIEEVPYEETDLCVPCSPPTHDLQEHDPNRSPLNLPSTSTSSGNPQEEQKPEGNRQKSGAKEFTKINRRQRNKNRSSSNIDRLLALQEKKMELGIKKFELQEKSQDQQFELRKLELEKEE